MITAPDFAKKQVLFLSTADISECHISFRNENIVISDENGTRDKVPLQLLVGVFLYGDTTLTTKLLAKFSKYGVSLFLLDRSLRIYASICPYAEGNYLLRQRQYVLDPETELILSRNIVENKIVNQLALLRSVGVEALSKKTLLEYKRMAKEKVHNARDLATLRGLEGTASREFFSAYFGTIGWYKRVPRAKVDENNILLDMGYSYLFNLTDSVMRLFGFDTYKGVYHRLFFQRKSLSCDIMEPFRCVMERTLLKMHTLGQFDGGDFCVRNGIYTLDYTRSAKYSKIFLRALMERKDDLYAYIRTFYYYVLNGPTDANGDDLLLPKFIIR